MNLERSDLTRVDVLLILNRAIIELSWVRGTHLDFKWILIKDARVR
jgi:hypothetical protein